MKTTLQERIRTAAEKARVLGNNAVKQPVSSILSLCVLGICAATLITFSQTNDTPPKVEVPATAQTMPVTRTLTSVDGRKLDVSILSKSETAIKARRTDGKEFEIKLDKLSEADKTFVDTLAEKKARVLLIGVALNNNFQMVTDTLKKGGFDVTIGLYKWPSYIDDIPKTYFDLVSKVDKVIWVNTLDAGDPYDILWIELFESDMPSKPNLYEIITRHNAAGKLTVIRSFYKTPKPDFFMVEGAIKIHTSDTSRKAQELAKREELISEFIIPYEKNWVFYDIDRKKNDQEKFYKSLMATVRKKLLDQ